MSLNNMLTRLLGLEVGEVGRAPLEAAALEVAGTENSPA
jgi:hypothetical protein